MDHGFLNVLPIIVAAVLTIITRETLVSLFAGIILGNIILTNGNIFAAFVKSMTDIMTQVRGNAEVIAFSLLAGALVILLQASGGVNGVVHSLTEKTSVVKNKKHALFLSYLIGLVLFFESSINILVSGTIAKAFSDKYKISSEELSYESASVCTSICGLFPFNGWGATLIGIIGVQIAAGTISGNPSEILIKSIPFNFYPWVTLLTLLFYIFIGKHWGPMKKASDRAKTTGKLVRDEGTPLIDTSGSQNLMRKSMKPDFMNMVLPLLVVILMMPVGLYVTGNGNMIHGSGSISVYWAVSAALICTAFYYIVVKKIMSGKEYMAYFYKGAENMVPVIILLAMSFTIGEVASQLNIGKYFAALINGRIHRIFEPTVIFILSAVISFATGTSWGTFALMMPVGLQMSSVTGSHMVLTVSSVISGALMGGSCSPVSDISVLSSMAAGADHIDHIKTQVPYAILNGIISTVLFIISGYIFNR